MSENLEHDSEEWRVVLLRNDASELLLAERGQTRTLPRFSIPRGSRVARELTARMVAACNLHAFALHTLPRTGEGDTSGGRVHLCEIVDELPGAPANLQWLPLTALADAKNLEPADADAIRKFDVASSRHGIGRPGTFPLIRGWVQHAIAPLGRTLRKEFEQLNAGLGFSLVRFETDRGPVWFKAVGEPNLREFPLTCVLSKALPRYLPQLLAEYPSWNAWLSASARGNRLSQCRDLASWNRAAHNLAEMQLDSLAMTDRLLACGARDVRIDTLRSRLAPFFRCVHTLIKRQTKVAPPALATHELEELEARTRVALIELQQDNIPDSLGHLDLNPENVISTGDHTVFLDWAEASVGHPFFSFAYLSEHFRASFPQEVSAHASLAREYARIWERCLGRENLGRTLAVAAFLAVFAHGVSTDAWRSADRLEEPFIAGYYRSLARRMKLYAERIETGTLAVSVNCV
jgi:hypothetical protein